jgi:hypothetical protein
MSKHKVMVCSAVLALLLVAIGVASYDYISFEARQRAAMAVVDRLGGRASSLGGWPLGMEYRIIMSRPLTDDEIEQLAILNLLADRNWVGVRFDWLVETALLERYRDVLSRCDAVGSAAESR